jgi:hypothetical protein
MQALAEATSTSSPDGVERDGGPWLQEPALPAAVELQGRQARGADAERPLRYRAGRGRSVPTRVSQVPWGVQFRSLNRCLRKMGEAAASGRALLQALPRLLSWPHAWVSWQPHMPT